MSFVKFDQVQYMECIYKCKLLTTLKIGAILEFEAKEMLFLYNLTLTVIITSQTSITKINLITLPFPHDYPPYHHAFWNDYNHPVNNQPTHPYQNHQMHTKDFARLNSTGNISTNQNQASENSENNDIRLLLESHVKITALVFHRKNSK